ncbi:MAG: hypothetical protein SGJ10_13535 [Bacteroidota bacterium]|nr:hypothetical protein [Bacteroidota bacterium]
MSNPFKQELISALMREHSIKNTMAIVGLIGGEQKKFDILMDLFFHGEYRIVQRASWVLGHCGEMHPQLIKKWIKPLLENLSNQVHDAVKRNTVRILQEYIIPEELSGLAYDQCFKLLISPTEPIAVKAFSMQVLYNITTDIPELKPELAEAISKQLPFGSAGLKSRGGKILKLLGY